jgi:hypothetical protein
MEKHVKFSDVHLGQRFMWAGIQFKKIEKDAGVYRLEGKWYRHRFESGVEVLVKKTK